MTAYREPSGTDKAGYLHYKQPPAPFDLFMREEGIPIYRGIGVYDSRELPLGDWKRTGGRGTYIQLSGIQGKTSLYVAEVPAAGALHPERHMYEERFIVLEGRGSTEVWRGGGDRKHAFEWQPGSVYSIPLNAWHRIVNATSAPALLLAVTNAPAIIDTFQNRRFVFDNPFDFSERFDDQDDFFKPRDDLEPHPIQGRAMIRTNLLPDAVGCYLPLDNNRGPGYRWISPSMVGNTILQGFIAEYPSGRYSKAHYHDSGAVLVCLRGKGYSLTWPVDLGTRPWESGKGELVKQQDYVPGGMISAAPGGGNWFHQHFAVGRDPFRVFNFTGTARNYRAQEGELVAGVGAEMGSQGGRALPYAEEDPRIREYYQSRLAEEGVEFQMPDGEFDL
jgi:quercetin dioxygenase-like cupin family protein